MFRFPVFLTSFLYKEDALASFGVVGFCLLVAVLCRATLEEGLISTFLGFQSSLIALVDAKEDYSDLPPNQRRKKLQQRIDEINTRLLQETATRDGLMKMKGVYEQNRALGDPLSIEGQLTESGQR